MEEMESISFPEIAFITSCSIVTRKPRVPLISCAHYGIMPLTVVCVPWMPSTICPVCPFTPSRRNVGGHLQSFFRCKRCDMMNAGTISNMRFYLPWKMGMGKPSHQRWKI
eukprot:PhF_6_TR30176/c1_g2_i1/m.44285